MIKARLICYLLLLGRNLLMQGQISMTIQCPPVGVLVKNQLGICWTGQFGNRSVLLRIQPRPLDQDKSTNHPC